MRAINLSFGILSLVLGFSTFLFAITFVPVVGLAFAAAGLLRESGGSKRKGVLIVNVFGATVCVLGILFSPATARRASLLAEPQDVWETSSGAQYIILRTGGMDGDGEVGLFVQFLSRDFTDSQGYTDPEIEEKEFDDMFRLVSQRAQRLNLQRYSYVGIGAVDRLARQASLDRGEDGLSWPVSFRLRKKPVAEVLKLIPKVEMTKHLEAAGDDEAGHKEAEDILQEVEVFYGEEIENGKKDEKGQTDEVTP